MFRDLRFRAPAFGAARLAGAGLVALALVATSVTAAQAAPAPRAAAVSATTSTTSTTSTQPVVPALPGATVVKAGQPLPADVTYPVITVGLNTITILLSPDNQKTLLSGGALAGAAYGAELCIAAGYADTVCAVAGFLIGAALVAFIQDKVSPKCNLQVVTDWSFNITGWSYPDCPGGP
jgi:hypothetical protein